MIDPKLQDLPASERTSNRPGTAAAKPRPGLSVNDTVAANANLSVGGRGADTSGVRTGAGAGAGGTYLTPANSSSSSPAPIVESDKGSTATTTISSPGDLSHEELSAHAYRCWEERGCPEGSPEVDWDRAERELREQRNLKSTAASA